VSEQVSGNLERAAPLVSASGDELEAGEQTSLMRLVVEKTLLRGTGD
jgi:hypothetical protein